MASTRDDLLTNTGDNSEGPVTSPDRTQKPASSTSASPANSGAASPVTSIFEFPTLNVDGSTPDLIHTHPPPGEVTPPAALSTLGIKMAAENKQSPPSELEDGNYDMVDDASEFSADGNETASLASVDEHSSEEDEGQLTPEDTGSVVDLTEDALQSNEKSSATQGNHALQDYQMQLMLLEQQNKKRLLMARAAQDTADAAKESEVRKTEQELESFLTEDLETPRQSTMYKGRSHTDAMARAPADDAKLAGPKTADDYISKARNYASLFGFHSILLVIAALTIWLATSYAVTTNPAAANTVRMDALESAYNKMTGATDASRTLNINHLLPLPTYLATNVFGQQQFGISEVRFQGILPNKLVVSLPHANSYIPSAKSTEVLKGDKPIAYNQTMLVPGVYEFAIDPKEAYGIVTVNMQATTPALNITVSHNYGLRLFQKQTYEKARTDLSKAVNKDVDVARKSAKSLSERIQLELGAGVAATKNVTTQLAVQINRDLSVWASNTAAALTKAAVASNSTYFAIQKDLMRLEQRLDDAGDEAVRMMRDAGKQVAKSVTEPLILSRERAVMLKDKLFGCKQGKSKRAGMAVMKPEEGRILRRTTRKLKAGSLPGMTEKRAAKLHSKSKKCGRKAGKAGCMVV